MKRYAEFALFLAGLDAVVFGLYKVYEPLAWIVGGLLLILLAVISRGRK